MEKKLVFSDSEDFKVGKKRTIKSQISDNTDKISGSSHKKNSSPSQDPTQDHTNGLISLQNNDIRALKSVTTLKSPKKNAKSISAFENILQGTADIIQKTRNSSYTGNSIPMEGTKARTSSKPKAVAAASSNGVDLSGVTLSKMLTSLVETRGFDALYLETNLRCFKFKPAIKSSLKVLRQPDMQWAKKKVEYLYLKSLKNSNRIIEEGKSVADSSS